MLRIDGDLYIGTLNFSQGGMRRISYQIFYKEIYVLKILNEKIFRT